MATPTSIDYAAWLSQPGVTYVTEPREGEYSGTSSGTSTRRTGRERRM